MDLLADTGFLIDLWREVSKPGAASRFASANAAKQIGLCWVVAGEFLCGGMAAQHDAGMITAFLARYPVVQSNPSIIHEYANLFVELKRQNQLIGPNDLWIAACARAMDLPLLTANTAEFKRVPGLTVLTYWNEASF